MKNKILLVEDNLILSNMIQKWLLKAGYEVLTASEEPTARRLMKKHEIALVLSDVRLPEGNGISLLEWSVQQNLNMPFVVMTGYASISDAVHAIKLGAKDYLPKPVYEDALLGLLHEHLNLPVSRERNIPLLERYSPAARQVDQLARRVATSDLPVMILGANGCGKESVAQSIHRHSRRKDKPFVAINCGCLPKDLIASELFGHVQGAFTGAVKDKEGCFAVAYGGTLFLDEIGNMSHEMQVALLRALQEKTYSPVGSQKVCPTNVRILSATNEDMEKAIREGRFREDLYHRLAGVEIHCPALTECPEDILPLAEHFRELYSKEIKAETCGFTEEAQAALLSHTWSGNVRELENRVKRAVLFADNPLITAVNLGLDCTTRPAKNHICRIQARHNEKERILYVLKENGGNITHAAEQLKISRQTLHKKINQYGLGSKE